MTSTRSARKQGYVPFHNMQYETILVLTFVPFSLQSRKVQFCRKNCHKPRIAPHRCGPADKCPGFSVCGRLDLHPEEKKRQTEAAKIVRQQALQAEKKAKEEAKAAARQRNKLIAPPGLAFQFVHNHVKD